MKLLSTFYSTGGDLAPGWWATIEKSGGRREYRLLWEEAAGPDFDDLAAVVAATPEQGLDAALQRARDDRRLVRRAKAVTPSTIDRGWVR
jgi:hypothetical protein